MHFNIHFPQYTNHIFVTNIHILTFSKNNIAFIFQKCYLYEKLCVESLSYFYKNKEVYFVWIYI